MWLKSKLFFPHMFIFRGNAHMVQQTHNIDAWQDFLSAKLVRGHIGAWCRESNYIIPRSFRMGFSDKNAHEPTRWLLRPAHTDYPRRAHSLSYFFSHIITTLVRLKSAIVTHSARARRYISELALSLQFRPVVRVSMDSLLSQSIVSSTQIIEKYLAFIHVQCTHTVR